MSRGGSLLQSAAATPKRAWAIHSDQELEAAVVAAPNAPEPRARLVAWLDDASDPRGALAALHAAGDVAAAERFIKRHAALLFGPAARRVSLKHIRVVAWRDGMAHEGLVRLDKATMRDIEAFVRCPAARFLSELTFMYEDQSDDPETKRVTARRHLEAVAGALVRTPCARVLTRIRVRSVDLKGQPAAVLREEIVLKPFRVMSFRRLTEGRVVFDSQA